MLISKLIIRMDLLLNQNYTVLYSCNYEKVIHCGYTNSWVNQCVIICNHHYSTLGRRLTKATFKLTRLHYAGLKKMMPVSSSVSTASHMTESFLNHISSNFILEYFACISVMEYTLCLYLISLILERIIVGQKPDN